MQQKQKSNVVIENGQKYFQFDDIIYSWNKIQMVQSLEYIICLFKLLLREIMLYTHLYCGLLLNLGSLTNLSNFNYFHHKVDLCLCNY